MKMKTTLILTGLLFFLSSCGGKGSSETNKSKEGSKKTITEMQFVEIPTVLTDVNERADFLLKHYWDKIAFNDSTVSYEKKMIEQSWVNYIDMIKKFKSPQEATLLFDKFFNNPQSISKEYLAQFIEFGDKYLNMPNSPIKDNELFIAYGQAIMEKQALTDAQKSRLAYKIDKARKNRVGELATDFAYTLGNGKTGNMYNIKSEYTLLFFNNPGCHACGEVIKRLPTTPIIKQLEKSGALKVLSIYPDEDLKAWKDHLKDLPKEWINSYDKDLAITEKELYDLSSIPSLYLLDRDKKVILRDVDAHQVISYFTDLVR